ncbi:MAG: NAD(P)-dependent oxidoreductase [Ectobacillus sp.]
MKLGFIGLGKMGGGLARNLIRAGFDVTVYDLSESAVQRVLEVGGTAAAPNAIAKRADVLFTSLPLPEHLLQLLVTGDALFSHMKRQAICIDVSTIDPVTARMLADEAARHEVDFLACPLGKGPAQAEEGTEPIFAGGKYEVFQKVEDILKRIGSPVTYLGDVEQSTAFKLISNMAGMANLAVLSEAFLLAEKVGIDLGLLKELLHSTGADSAQLRLRGPLMINNDYEPMFSVHLAEKDVRFGAEMAKQLSEPAPFSSLALSYLQAAQKQGYGHEDCAALYKVFGVGCVKR